MGNHSHSHDHGSGGHSHHHGTSFNSAFAIAVSVTLVYALSEAGYAFYANSLSLLADAVHNLGDVLGLGLAWAANWLLSFPARKRYSYGFKRTTIIAALVNAFILVATSAVIAYASIHKLMHITEINEHVVIVMGLIGILVNVCCSLLFMRGAENDINIKGAFLHLMADALILVGVVVSAIIINYTNWHWLDPIVGLIIVGIVLLGTWGLLRDSLSLILDAVPRYIDQSGVLHYLQALTGVTTVHDLHIWGLSTKEVALTAHLVAPNRIFTDADYKQINHDLHEKFRIDHVTLQVELGSEDPCVRSKTC